MPLEITHVTPLIKDAAEVARVIIEDMGPSFWRPGLFWARYLADTHGGDWHWADLKSRRLRGCCYHGSLEILIEADQSDEWADVVLRHELAHRFAFGERYAYLNDPKYSKHNWRDFHEAIATIVGNVYEMFVHTGRKLV